MSATTSPAMQRNISTRRQPSHTSPSQHAYSAGGHDGPQRSMSHPMSPTSPGSHSRSNSGATGNLSHVARRDGEQINLARPSTSHQPDARDHASSDGPARSDYRRESSERHSRHVSGATAASHEQHQPRRRTTVEAKTGVWELGKTIGAGSMGKVKLARNKETHEQVAIKIVPRQSTDEHKSTAEKERADHSKEVRTAREAAISTLADHPYICGMRDFIKTRYHWYMLFEYVNGGQMLDYIISHGRLKEKQARKFGRQIASALDYCHRNNIVHRDLKIENILISKTGDIKIIDFGLSNTFTPRGYLKTFCGSLYFAAPELLQAKQYTGPEVDVWSFGIVLYVLVCGKVPFDDQSMPQLHAKIKKGHVDYPPWLTHECRSLISRMLQTDPSMRANMTEIMCHPWMTKGFGSAPDNFLPQRRPLTLPLDRNVIRKMEGFDFGTEATITEQLQRIVESEDYQKAIFNYEKKPAPPTPEVDRKRGVFDFYKRRNSLSRDTLQSVSSEAVQWGADPINAYHPLVSVYFLAKEKMEREYRAANPGSPPMEENKSPILPPQLKAPEAAYTNPAAYEMAGEAPTGGRSRPRSRTHGQDDAIQGAKHVKIEEPPAMSPAAQKPSPTIEQSSAKKESTAAGLLRKLSTRRHKDYERPPPPPPSFNVTSPQPDTLPRKSFSLRRKDRSSSRNRAGTTLSPQPDRLDPVPAEDKNKSGGLNRSVSVNSGDMRQRLAKRQTSEQSTTRIHRTPDGKRKLSTDQVKTANDGTSSDIETPKSAPPASRTKSLGHARKESIQRRRQKRAQTKQDEVREETDAELADMDDDAEFTANEGGSPGAMKPVFLKGLFSVSTTSSKPFRVIEADIVRVLRQLNIQYSCNGKGGFKCKHSRSISIDTTKGADDVPKIVTPLGLSQSHRRRLSFGFLGGDREDKEKEAAIPRTPTLKRNSRRYDELSDDDAVESEQDDNTSRGTSRLTEPSPSARAAGETTTHVQNDLGTDMDLRFEIFVVKVPLLSLHGIQFKKVDGGTWQYKNMAQTILNELRL